ncbi:hypothetical protein ACS0TY_005028 [Phlomoides rotata]
MFYSQFILAKKGPLGTIWIAAHLERKLRKNQVADTDIGVSVDSILFPDVPIALRLSSHLLLGVVRIYNKKVNYLFDDCSEALLKVKQAFRSTTVDLPPEESKAPYHSITLPEKFDLDDFELPDSDIFQGNYVDHHISSREQITLQDTMEGVSYSTSKFGLDERFGDGDTSGLDLDEDLFLGKSGTEGHADERADPQTSFGSVLALKQDQQPEDRAANSEAMVDGDDDFDDVMDYAQAPCTPGLVEEPNLANVQDASACDDHLESEYHLMTSNQNANDAPSEHKQEVDWCSQDVTISDAVPQGPSKENEYLLGGFDINESMPQGKIESNRPASEFTNGIIKASDVSQQEDAPTEAVNNDQICLLSVNETCFNHQGPNEIDLEESVSVVPVLATTDQHATEDVSAKDLAPLWIEVSGNVEDTSNLQKSCHGESEFVSENQVRFVETPETQAFQGATDSSALNLDAHDKEAAYETPVLRPCSSIQDNPDVIHGFSRSIDSDLISGSNAIAVNGREETANLGEVYCVNGDSEQNLMINQVQGHASGDDIQLAISEANVLVHTTDTQDRLVVNLNNPAPSELPVPEKLLSVPEGHMDLHKGMVIETSPVDVQGLDEGDHGSRTAAGRKRSFTESTLTEQSLNSVESSRQVRFKQTGSVPNDDDLLSSILVGRRSSILKVKPTPPPFEVTSSKRTRSAPRSRAPKRKVIMDDTMVLHGDTIRQQLTNTEDIRRVRKKAPCTLPEISMIQKQHMEEENFLQPIFSGMSVELASLHGQVYDLSRIRVTQDGVNDASLDILTEPRLPSQNDRNDVSTETMVEPNLASYYEKSGASPETVSGLHLTSPNNRDRHIEDGMTPGNTSVTEISGPGLNDDFFTVGDNETAEPSVDPLLSENKAEEVDYANIASPSVFEPFNSTGHVTDDMGDALDGRLLMSSLNELGDTNAYANTDAAVFSDPKKDALSVDLDYADLDNGEAIVKNEVGEKDGYALGKDETILGDVRQDLAVEKDGYALGEGETILEDVRQDLAVEKDGYALGEGETILGDVRRDLAVEKDGDGMGEGETILGDVRQDPAAVELASNANHGELEYHADGEFCSTMSKEQQGMEFSCPGLENMQDGFMNNSENPDISEAYGPNMVDAEFSGFDRDELNYSAAGNDTEFLNIDDDDLTEMADDNEPGDEEAQYTDNSGWSSRTRAVSKYLQAAFVKEADCGRKSLSLDKLLIGKSRKEASRMFFETLVLKTKDYIHVEQQKPFDDISIKPRARLMISDF